jgi:membrane-bound lytic murein transglycosylase D
MKKYTTLTLLLVVVSLLGCNTLVTKTHSAKTGEVDHAAYENQATDSPVAIDDVSTDVVLSESEQSTQIVKERIAPLTESLPFALQSTEVSKPSANQYALHWANKPTAKEKLTETNPNTQEIIAEIITPNTEVEANDSFETNDLWQRLRQSYGLPAIDNGRVQRELKKFVNSPSYFKRITNKARPYLYHIVEELEKREMPLEIALLPAIESAYEPLAVSYKSAAGLWQFMPATGEDYGLRQNYWYDGRRDIIKSTTAALDYLQRLHKLFDGDWLRALAAYNYGEGNVTKAINRNKKLEQATDFWSLKLPKETSEYVPKLLALSKVVANPQKYGIQLQAIANKRYLKRVNVGRQIDLSLAAQLAGLSISDLKRLNPAYRRGVTAPRGPHYVTIPVHNVRQFKERLAKIPPQTLLAQASTSRYTKTQRHIVKKGENLTWIAKRYGMTVAELSQLNNLKDGPLYVGKRLKVRASETDSVPAKTQKHKVRRGENLTRIAKRYGTTVAELRQLNNLKDGPLYVGKQLKVRTSRTKTVPAKTQMHKVCRGENLTRIAKRYGMTVAELRQLNNLKGGPLYVGKRLKVRASRTKTVPAKTQKHKVRSGENLTRIAKRYGMTVAELRQLNNLKDGPLYVGKRLKVRASRTKTVPAKTQKHKVRSGENLTRIAKRYGMTVAELRQLNNLKGGHLQAGKQLKVRASRTKTVPAKTQMHKVRRGENLTTIAKRYGTTVSLLREWNNIKGNVVKFGQFLKVPARVASSVKKSKKKKIIHRVKYGESLGRIARTYQVSLKELTQWNNLRKDKYLLKGQKLTIWVDG